MNDLPVRKTPSTSRVAEFLEKFKQNQRARIVFVIDATGSRQPTWDLSAQLQADMFSQAAELGTLDLQLVYFRGMAGADGECKAGPWTNSGADLARLMGKIVCRTGMTQIVRALQHVKNEHQRQPISAAVYVGDMVEEPKAVIYDTAAGCAPLFVFGEGADPHATPIFREMARLTNGAYAPFDAGSAAQLRELLRAVAAFAVGGVKALANQNSEAARTLLTQMKPEQ